MLLEKDCFKTRKSSFKCDRCKINLTSENKYAIYVQHAKLSPKKNYDLCSKCFDAFKRGIRKGTKMEGGQC